MSTAAPITSVVAVHEGDELTATAEIYAAMADELAGMVETSEIGPTTEGRILTDQLATLHVVLDECTATLPTRRWLVGVANRVERLREFAAAYAELSRAVHALLAPLAELHAVLVDELAVQPWRAEA